MPSATLSISEWEKVLKTSPGADSAAKLTEALKKYDKVGTKKEEDSEKVLEALKSVIDCAETVSTSKKNAAHKAMTTFLGKLLKEAKQELS